MGGGVGPSQKERTVLPWLLPDLRGFWKIRKDRAEAGGCQAESREQARTLDPPPASSRHVPATPCLLPDGLGSRLVE